MNINPINIKVENPEKIRQLAADVVSQAKSTHPLLEETYTRFIDEGVKAPYFAQMSLKNAEYDSYIKTADEYAKGLVDSSDYYARYKITRSSLSELDRSPIGMRLYNAMKEQAIKNITVSPDDKKAYKEAIKKSKDIMQKRIAILSGLAEGSRELVPCYSNKAIKKFTYKFLRLVNRF